MKDLHSHTDVDLEQVTETLRTFADAIEAGDASVQLYGCNTDAVAETVTTFGLTIEVADVRDGDVAELFSDLYE